MLFVTGRPGLYAQPSRAGTRSVPSALGSPPGGVVLAKPAPESSLEDPCTGQTLPGRGAPPVR